MARTHQKGTGMLRYETMLTEAQALGKVQKMEPRRTASAATVKSLPAETRENIRMGQLAQQIVAGQITRAEARMFLLGETLTITSRIKNLAQPTSTVNGQGYAVLPDRDELLRAKFEQEKRQKLAEKSKASCRLDHIPHSNKVG